MHKFIDGIGEEWMIEITIGHIKPIEAETGVNLLKLDKPFHQDSEDWLDQAGNPLILMTRLDMDLELLFSVIYAAVKPQAISRGVNEIDFGLRMKDEGHINAYNAFWEELQDFFQNARRTHLYLAIQKQRAVMAKAMERAGQRITDVDEDKVIREILGSSSGAMQGSSASTQDRSPSANLAGRLNRGSNTTGGIPAST